ncbi:DUF3883 domain-containing protein [Terrimonas alba]|uniref:DUF3883 domain-containing protein n=1 Tax=Terrimonas alba TaxID=3349636 RepID=UPI0035F2E655
MDWSKEEVALIVADYFEMFNLELHNTKYNKAEHRRSLARLLNNRDKAIEFKHQNISGALAMMGLPFIKGYKPLFNYQQLLADEVAEYLQAHKFSFEKEFKKFADEKTEVPVKKIDFNKVVDSKPVKQKYVEREPKFIPIKTNYLEKEQHNRSLGEKGESFVIDYEKWRLNKAGKENLADKVEWISQKYGDGTGFDILSKNNNGTDRYIEVKTTKLTKETPIYLSSNEVKFAHKKAKDFYLYRVFNFADDPKLFIKHGHYDDFCKMVVQTYKGYFH